MTKFRIQHNGKGKSHLMNDDLEILCRASGEFNFSDPRKLVIRDGKYYEDTDGWEQELSPELVEFVYCKKCLKHHDKHSKDHTN